MLKNTCNSRISKLVIKLRSYTYIVYIQEYPLRPGNCLFILKKASILITIIYGIKRNISNFEMHISPRQVWYILKQYAQHKTF
jgi:hypothetical protein